MINLDKIKEEKQKILGKLSQAVKAGDDSLMSEALSEFSTFISEQVKAEAEGSLEAIDSQILSARGCRPLTSEESKYYQKVIEASKSPNFKQEIANIQADMPFTIIDSVLEDVSSTYELLGLLNVQNTTAITKWIINKEGYQTAVWGELNSEITKELEGSIGVIDTFLNKLTAFMFVSMDMLDLGPSWIDRYVRAILVDAIGYALETKAVSGTGKNEPIGMIRDVSDDVTVTAGVYPEKDPITVSDFSPKTYGEILAKLATTPSGKSRIVKDIVLIVNPEDYFKLVMPATTIQLPNGSYANEVLPVPTKIIQSVGAPKGKAVIGIAKRYFVGVGTGKNGKLEYDDSYKYLEDQRTYKIKLHATGLPMDNNAFAVLDISGLEPLYLKVKQVSDT